MKIFAIRDRMLDYFQVPVVVNREQDLVAAVAKQVNGGANEVAQAPDHFEIWEIAEVDDQGHIQPTRVFKCNCASLVRNGVWKRGESGADGAQGDARTPPGRIPTPGGREGAGPGPAEGPKGAAAQQAP